MSLSDRLSRIIGEKKPVVNKPESKSPLDEHIRGEWISTGSMKVFQTESSTTFDFGRLRLDKISSILGIDIPDPEKMLFFDTETTGLAGGTGTYAFLIGIGFFTGSKFLVIQLFMPGFADEPALLETLSAIGKDYTHLVSFNGKMFDQPLLATRFLLSRVEDSLKGKPHIDLLHLSRPVWKRRLDSCSLKSLEANVLGHDREDDIDGALIPEVYFDWLRTGNPSRIAQVFEHNRQDVASMATLLSVLDSMYENPESSHFSHTVEMLGMARYFENKGSSDMAVTYLEKALDCEETQIKDEALVNLGKLHKKRGDHAEAQKYFSKVSNNSAYSILALCEQAKHLEHRMKDYDKALELTNIALAISRNNIVLTGLMQDLEDLRKRADRLVSKKLKTRKQG